MSAKSKKRRKVKHRKSIRNHINKIFEGIKGNGLDDKEYDPKFATTYGELTLEGIEGLVKEYKKVKKIETYPTERQVFYDLGSGTGKIVMMVAALLPSLKAYGIELVKHRHEKALTALEQTNSKNNITFLHGSFLDYDIRDAGWIFISNLCFSNDMNKEIAEKIEKEVQKDTLIACSRHLPLDPNHFEDIKFVLAMTWEKKSSAHLYRKL